MSNDALIHALEQVPALSWTADEHGAVDWTSAALARYVGLSEAGMGPSEWASVVHPADFPDAFQRWNACVASGEPYSTAVRLRVASTGLYRWYLCKAQRHEDAGRIRWVGLNIDIDAARREIELRQASVERLQLEREHMRAVLMEMPVGVTVYTGPELTIDQMNPAMRQMVGGRSFEGQTLAQAFPEVVEQGFVELIGGVLETGEAVQLREAPVDLDRRGAGQLETGYFDITLQPLSHDDGARYGVLGCSVEVTEQVQARRELARVAAEREAILQQLNEGVIIVDSQGRITFVNDRARELHGVEQLDVGPDDYAQAYALLRDDGTTYPSLELPLARAVLNDETVVDAPWCIRRPDGVLVHVEGSARPVRGRDGEKIGAVLTLHERRGSRAG